MGINILIVDDHAMFRSGIRSIIEQQPGLCVVAEGETGREAVELAEEYRPEVVVMDVVMPELNGIEATRQIHESNPNIGIVVISATPSGSHVGQVLKLGASAYVPKTAVVEELLEAIKCASRGQVFLSRSVTGDVVDRYVRNTPNGNGNGESQGPGVGTVFDHLTPREREVLQLVAEGNPTRVIASQLSVSVKTVESHRQTVMRKLDLDSVAHLTKYAVREGLTTLD